MAALRLFFAELSHRNRMEGAVSLLSSVRDTLLNQGLKLPSSLEASVAQAVEAYASQVEVLPGALELLHYFSHLPKAIITNGPSDMQWAAIRKVGLEPHFKTVVVSGDPGVAVRKPNPRIFQIACERLGIRPEEALMIGDNLEADVQGAIAFGMQGILLNPAAREQ